MINQKLFIDFLRVYAFQPATGFWRAVEVDILKKYLPTSGTCLDLGCGDGKLTSIAYDGKVPDELILIGVDSDPDETMHAAKYPFYKRIHTCLASNIPEEDGIFDAAFSNSVLEHIRDIEATLAGVSRLLKPGGYFVFTVPAPSFHQCLYGPLNRKDSREEYLKHMDERLAHYRYWDIKEWRSNLARAGMKVTQTAEYFNCKEARRWETISRFTAGIMYSLGRQKRPPIELQKKVGMRQFQNRVILPRWMAALLAWLLSIGVKETEHMQNACLLIVARKNDGR